MRKRITLIGLSLLFGLSLASCKKTDDNLIPASYRDIDKDAVVVKNKQDNELSITNKELYDRLKFKYGASVSKQIIDSEILYKVTDNEKKEIYDKNKREINLELLNDIYGTKDLRTLKLYAKNNTSSKENRVADGKAKLREYIVKLSKEAIIVTEEDFNYNVLIDNQTNELYIEFETLTYNSKGLYKQLLNKIKEEKFKALIKENGNNVELENKKTGKKEKNKVLTDKVTLERYFMEEYRNFYNARAIILRYNSYDEAMASLNTAIKNANETSLNDKNAEKIYMQLYNDYYKYEDKMTNMSTDERALIKYDQKGKDTPIKIIDDKFKELKNGEYTVAPYVGENQANFHLIYRKEVKYYLGIDENNYIKAEKFPDISEQHEDYKALLDFYIKEMAKVSSVQFFWEGNLIQEAGLKIHDVFVEEKYKETTDNYSQLENKDRKDYIIEANNLTFTAKEFYEELKKQNTTEAIYEIMLEKKLLKEEENLLDDKNKIENEVKESLKKEKKELLDNKMSFDKSIGFANYLFIKYGHYKEEEVIKSRVAEEIKTKFLNKKTYDSWSDESHYLSDTALKLFDLVKEAANYNYNNLNSFTMDIKHLLMYVDINSDKEADDMDVFLSSLNVEEKKSFEQMVVTEYKKIIKLYNFKVQTEKLDTLTAMKEIADLFNTRGKYTLSDGKEISFDTKGYRVYLKAEDLSSTDRVTNKSVNSYVKPFKTYIQNIAKFLEDDKNKDRDLEIKSPTDKDGNTKAKLITETKFIKSDSDLIVISDLCASQFGYHLIGLNNYYPYYKDRKSPLDSFENTEYIYKKITITKGKKTDDDKNPKDKTFISEMFANVGGINPALTTKLAFLYYAKINAETHITYTLEQTLKSRLEDVVKHISENKFQLYTAYFAYVYDNQIVDESLKSYNREKYAKLLEWENTEYKAENQFQIFYKLTEIENIFKRK